MSDGYVKSTWGCNRYSFDSSFKRYNRAHLGGDFTINIFSGANAGWGCGCGCGNVGGFWGGFGLALGNFAGNLLMGGMNMLGGWAGGLGGMFGGLGAGWGGSGWGWGNSGVKDYDYYALRYGTSKKTDKADTDNDDKKTDKAGDKDYVTLNNLDKKELALERKTNLTAKDIEDLLKELNEAKDTDNVNTDDNTTQKQTIIDRLKNFAKDNGFEIDESGKVAKTEVQPVDNEDVNEKIKNVTELKQALEAKLKAINSNLSVELDGNKVTVKGILFETGKADIKDGYHESIKTVASVLKSCQNTAKLTITGNTSKLKYPKNSTIENTKLADNRASVVGTYFMNYCAKDNISCQNIEYGEPGVETDKYGNNYADNQNVVLEIEIQDDSGEKK